MATAYDATFTTGGAGIHDVPVSGVGSAGLWVSEPAGHWSVSGSILTGLPAGSAPSFLTRPSAEPSGWPIPWGSSQAIIGVTPPGGWSSSATGWGLALCWSMPGSDPGQAVYYLLEARPGTVSSRPNTLTVSRVEAGTSTALGSVAWTNDSTHDYDMVFESWCEALGKPVSRPAQRAAGTNRYRPRSSGATLSSFGRRGALTGPRQSPVTWMSVFLTGAPHYGSCVQYAARRFEAAPTDSPAP